MRAQGLLHGPLGSRCVHLCVDMQRLFGPEGPWHVPWMESVLPAIDEVCSRHAEHTIFTRFIPADNPDSARGAWSRYYRRWHEVTLSRLDPRLVDLSPALARHAPPARVVDKRVYSPWTEGILDSLLVPSPVDTLVITGGETDMCVLATVLGAVDRGYRVIVAADAVCSSKDETHDSILRFFGTRFSEQIEIATIDEILTAWR